MNVRSLIIENLRGFTSRNEVMFTDPDIAVFVGVNGSGKSTILEAIFTSFYPLSVFSEINNIGEWSYFTGKDISNGSTASFIEMQFGLSAGSNEEHSVLSVGNVMSGFQIQNEYASQTKSLQDFLVNSLVTGLELPILAFYKNSSPIRLQKKGSSEYANFNIRQQAYQEALRLSVDFDSIENFYKNLLNLQNSEVISKKQWNYKLPAVETFNQGITAFLDKLEGDSNTPGFIDFSVKEFNQVISYSKNDINLAFNQLSSGEKYVIGLALDLIYRCIAANSKLADPLESKGVVLIDEIELHLHPRWQANIIGALTATFPNIQFIISTHSPLVINQLKPEQLFVLKDNQIIPGTRIQNTYGMDVNSVVSEIMGGSYRPKPITKAFEKIEKLLDDPKPENLTAVKALLQELSSKISPNDSELLQLKSLLKLEESEADY